MTIKGFLKYVEIQTKVASIIPFLLGTLYAKYRFDRMNGVSFLVMLISLLSFDMATTAINNYVDYKKSQDYKNAGNEKTAYIREGISVKKGKIIIFVLLFIAISFGIILTLRTNVVVLLIGALAFGVGVFYTYGPIPISRMPLGEIFSGFFMGFIILFLAIYIHVCDGGLVEFKINAWKLMFNIDLKELLFIFLVSIPAIVGIANIMLANNICDIEEDIKINRFTLPYYIGKKNAVFIFRSIYYIGYLDMILVIILKIAPVIMIFSLLTLIPVNKSINTFGKKQEKASTFILSVKNFVLMTGSQVIIYAIVALF